MKTLIVASSLNPESKSSRIAALIMETMSQNPNQEIQLLDLRQKDFNHLMRPETADDIEIKNLCEWADNFIFAIPIYNYNVSDAFATFAGKYLGRDTGQMYGLIFAAGGPMSMLVTSAAHQMIMTHNRLHPLPRALYITGKDFLENGTTTPEIQERINQFINDFCDLGRRLL